MACDLTRGRKEACLDSTGGIKTVYFVDYGDLGTITKTDDEITDLGGTFTAYKYEFLYFIFIRLFKSNGIH